jgi:signal transduction histidine kinase/DNA-binding response OmpR family regulator
LNSLTGNQTERNRETIQSQQLQLQKERGRMLLVIIFSVLLLFALTLMIIFFRFRSRVRKQVDAAREKFFANVVHEIRTPLSMIGAPVSLLKKKITDPESLQHLQLAEKNIGRLNELINQMLDISTLDAARYILKESYGQLSEFLHELFLPFDARATEKGLKFSMQVDLPEEQIYFDRDAMEKIVGNLLDNAIKYTPVGGSVGMDVSGSETENGQAFILQVWDTGNGISKSEKENVFKRFYRSQEHQDAGVKGVGIGLALVNELVQLMHGTIDLESEVGKGSVFTVQLIFRKRETIAVDSVSSNGICILLVEDDRDILEFNGKLLEENGFQVLKAGNGEEALSILKEQLPELIITDLMMPGKDGLALLKEVRATTATEHIPVIILSAKSSAPVRLEGMREGAQAYLGKPFIPDELLGLVQNQLNLLAKQREHYQQRSKETEPTIEERYAGTDPFTQQFFKLVIQHLDNSDLSVEQLAGLMNINRSHFQRKMKTLTGYSPSELLRIIRLEKAREFLVNKKGNVTEIAYLTGFTSQSYFSKCFVQQFGFAPSAVGKS